MKLFASLFFFFLTGFALPAQDAFQELVDSVKQLELEERLKTLRELTDMNSWSAQQQGKLFHDLGTTCFASGDLIGAIRATKRALEIRQAYEQDAPIDVVVSAFNLAYFYQEIEAYDQALDYFQWVLDRAPNRKLGEAFYQIGRVYTAIGEYKLGEQAFISASQEREWILSAKREALLFLEWADLYLHQDKQASAQKAIPLLRKALRIIDSLPVLEFEDSPNLKAFTLNRLGLALIQAGHFSEANLTLKTALQRSREESFPAVVYTNLGLGARREGRLEEALDHHRKALAIHRKWSQERPDMDMARVSDNLATVFLHMGRLQEGLQQVQSALKWALADFNPRSPEENPKPQALFQSPYKVSLLIYLQDKAIILERMADLDPAARKKAIEVYHLCDQLMDRLREDHIEQRTKLFWREQAKNIYQSAVRACYQGGRPEDAFYFSEKSRAVLLLDGRRELNANSRLPEPVRRRLAALSAEIRFFQKQFYEQKNEKKQEALVMAQQQYRALIDSLKRKDPDYYRLKYRQDFLRAGEIKNQLKADQVLVEYFLADSQTLALVVDRAGVRMVGLPAPDKLESNARRLLKALKDPQNSFPPQPAWQLYQQLIAPLKIDGFSEVILIPDGLLSLLPFEALLSRPPKPGTPYRDWPFLLKKQGLRYAFSANVLFTEIQGRRRGNGRVLALAPMARTDPDFGISANLELSRSQPMLDLLSGILPMQILQGREANRNAFQQMAGEFSVLHLATHAYLDHENPDYNHFLLADRNSSSRRYYANELYQYQFQADLAILGACETGAGPLQRGEGVASLGRAFAYSGCPNLALSLWQVDEGATATLTAMFYEELKKGKAKGEALRLAKLHYLQMAKTNQLAHPFRWSGFVYYGDAKQLRLSNSRWGIGLATAGLSALLIGIWSWRRRSGHHA